MHRRSFLCGLAGGTFVGPSMVRAGQGFDLISAEDYARRRPRVATRMIAVLKADGPKILFHAPRQSRLHSPVDFDVEFRGREGVPPVLASLRVDYDLGITWFNITDRLLAHARIASGRMKANGAQLPKGRHRIRLGILDMDRRKSEAVVTFEVR